MYLIPPLPYSTFASTRSNQNFLPNLLILSFRESKLFLTLVMVYIFAHFNICNIVNRSRTNRYFHEKNSFVSNSLIRRILIFTDRTCDSASTELIFLERYTRIFFKSRRNWLFFFAYIPLPIIIRTFYNVNIIVAFLFVCISFMVNNILT